MVGRAWRDGAVVAGTLTLCLAGATLRTDDTLAAPSPVGILVAATSSLVTLLRHRSPVLALVAATVCGMLIAPVGMLVTPLTTAPAILCAAALALRDERPSTVALVLGCSALLVVPVPFLEHDITWADTSRLVTVAAGPLAGAAVGRLTRHRREHLRLVEERARRAEEARDSEARRMVTEERVRIARELHDLVAHQITLANAQANVAVQLFDARPERARENVEALVRTTRHALDELRATVGLLRQPDERSAPPEPAPGLAGLSTLIDSFRRAGLEVTLLQDGTDGASGAAVAPVLSPVLSPALDLTAYRIVQEALTNVAKHAGVASATVRLSWASDALTLEIADEGSGRGPTSTGPPGYGLIGLRERATAVGGQLASGDGPDGGFLVRARLPLPMTSRPVTGREGSGSP